MTIEHKTPWDDMNEHAPEYVQYILRLSRERNCSAWKALADVIACHRFARGNSPEVKAMEHALAKKKG